MLKESVYCLVVYIVKFSYCAIFRKGGVEGHVVLACASRDVSRLHLGQKPVEEGGGRGRNLQLCRGRQFGLRF